MKILIVEDEVLIREGMSDYLMECGHEVFEAGDGHEALGLFYREMPDLVLLDIQLPILNGLEVLKTIRKTSSVPVLMLTAFHDEDYKLTAFGELADGYLEKPFSLSLLKVRIEAIFKKLQPSRVFTYGEARVDFESYTASIAGQAISMNAKELEILEYLLQHEGKARTRSQILDAVWKETEEIPFDRVIDVYIKELRKKLELDCIVTVRNVGIFAKIFLITFALFSSLVILLHASVYFIFPSTYIESQRQTILKKSEALAKSFQGQEEGTIESVIDLYSKTNDIKISIKGKEKQNAIEVKDDLLVNPDSQNNSLVIEERKIQTKEGQDLTLQFLATIDSQKEARDISLGFLPYTLLASFVLSLIASYLYARMISAPILEIKRMTKRMKRLDRTASLPIDSQDEIGVLKQQINDLYHHLLEVIDNLEQQKQENLKLEQMKVEFLRGASHELKTPLASLKIILENMRDKIGRYKDRDRYLLVSLDIVDEMNQIVLEILSLSSVQELGGDKEWIQLDDVVNRILTQNQVLVENRSLSIDNYLPATSIFMNLPILKLVLSNIISNAVKHSDKGGVIRIGLENEGTDFVIENTIVSKENTPTKVQSKKEGGLGLFVVKYLLEHEELSYRFEESSTGRRFVMVLPKK